MATKVVDAYYNDAKVLGEWRVAPPANSVPPTELRLSYFDVAMLNYQGDYLLFFDFLGTTQDFRDESFPRLRRSLSLTLSLFYPLAGRLIIPSSPDSYDPVIRYSEGDFVTVTLAESGADFASLVRNQAKEAEAFHPLVPPLQPVNITSVSTVVVPLMAFQVTVFPGSGFSIGMKFNHAVADGFSFIHFLKSCAAISKAGGADVSAVRELPVFDRALLGADREPLKRTLLKDLVAAAENEERRRRRLASRPTESPEDDDLNQKPRLQLKGRMTRATFVLKRAHMETLRRKMMMQLLLPSIQEVGPRMSTFAATCAFVWVCLAKSRPVGPTGESTETTLCFWMPANLRPRLFPPVTSSYFGNVSPVGAVVELSHAELTGENGLATASKAIQLAIRQLDEGRVRLLEAHLISVNRRFKEVMGSKPREHRFSIAGSPTFRAYDVDFGFGRPRKIEYPSIEMTEFVSFNDSRDEEGGVEIGLGCPEEEMLRFSLLFKEGLEAHCT